MYNVLDLRPKKQSAPKKEKEEEEEEKKKTEEKPKTLEWKAPEYQTYKKSKDWFWLLFIAVAVLLVIAFIAKNFLFGIFIFIAGFAIAIFAVKKPDMLNIVISTKGVEVSNTLYPYENLESFWIFYKPPELQELSIKSKKLFMSYIKIPLGDMDPEQVKEFIKDFVPEQEQTESLIDALARRLRF
ncbi:hypothetical protein ACFL3E_00195 [Patescibacteria group bacterium]